MTAAGRPLSADDLAQRLDVLRRTPGIALVAVEWGPPSGLIVAHWHQTLVAPRPMALISTLLVAPDARRRGIGRVLLKSASQAARSAGCDSLDIHASSEDIGLRAFCLATGFSEDAVGFVRPLRKRTDHRT